MPPPLKKNPGQREVSSFELYLVHKSLSLVLKSEKRERGPINTYGGPLLQCQVGNPRAVNVHGGGIYCSQVCHLSI